MTEPGLQRDGKNEATMTSTLTPPPLIMVNKLRAPVADLSPTKRSAVIECFNNNGLFKRNGYWWERQKASTSQGSLLQISLAMAYSR